MTSIRLASPPQEPLIGNLSAFQELVVQWKSDTACLQDLDPQNATIASRKRLIQELEEAIAIAKNTKSWLSISEASEQSKIPTSTLRYYGKHRPEAIGAQKIHGAWRIDARALEAFVETSHRSLMRRAA